MPIDPDAFRDVLRHFPAGVTLVTAGSGADVHGLTVSAFASVSAEPPMIAVVLDLRNKLHPYLEAEGAPFAVNILGEDQAELSNRFAFGPREERFDHGDWRPGASGVPILSDALAWLECEVEARLEAGSHVIYVGRVEHSGVPRPDESPLVYWNRAYRRLALDDAPDAERAGTADDGANDTGDTNAAEEVAS